ncbi:MAG: uracil-DNA glycosylase family protein [Pseudomonadota bacterium]
MKLKSLVSKIKRCELCQPHLPLGPRPVLQVHEEARVLIAGQAPGIRVHQSGVPFDDPSGDRLREWMGVDKTVFYDSKQVAIVPMGFCYPGTGKSGDLPPRKECADTWRQPLLDKLPNIKLQLVIGQYAHKWHLESLQKNLTETVKHWRDYGRAVLPLPHPSPKNNIWLKKNPWFVEELVPELRRRVRKALGTVKSNK